MQKLSSKMINNIVLKSLTVIFFVMILIAGASAGSPGIMGEENTYLVNTTQTVILTSLAQEDYRPTDFVYSEDVVYGSPPSNNYNDIDFPTTSVKDHDGFLYSKALAKTSPGSFVYDSEFTNDNRAANQPDTEIEFKRSDAEVLPISGGMNYTSIIALWFLIIASYFLKAGIIGKLSEK